MVMSLRGCQANLIPSARLLGIGGDGQIRLFLVGGGGVSDGEGLCHRNW